MAEENQIEASLTSPSTPVQPWTAARRKAWYSAIVLVLFVLIAFGLLLARLIWLPFYFGLFFFLIAGLLAGAISFRLARAARPLTGGRILRGIAAVTTAATLATIVWEYEHVAGTAGDGHKFPEARNAAVKAGQPAASVRDSAEAAFRAGLRAAHPPGGPVGYIRWAISKGELELTVSGERDVVSVDHRGYAWPVRTLIGALLMGLGLWSSLESLRSPMPVSNILSPGEPYEEDD